MLQRVAVCCSILQYVAVCCSIHVYQTRTQNHRDESGSVLQYIVARCSVCCSVHTYQSRTEDHRSESGRVLQCCGALQYVAVLLQYTYKSGTHLRSSKRVGPLKEVGWRAAVVGWNTFGRLEELNPILMPFSLTNLICTHDRIQMYKCTVGPHVSNLFVKYI